MSIKFTVTGNPVPWARARMFGKRFFTEPRVAKAKKLIALLAQSAMKGKKPMKGSISVDLHFFRATRQRCDIDRLCSLPLDAMNGIVYEDDRLVDILISTRQIDKKNPRTEVCVSELQETVK